MKKNNEAIYSVKDFGAKGDGKTDDTLAIQNAIDTVANKNGGAIYFPPGIYLVSHITIRSYIKLFSHPTWSYHDDGAVSIQLIKSNYKNMVTLSDTRGVRISGLSFNGADIGENQCCFYLDAKNRKQENTVFIENNRISHFSGDAIYVESWCTTIRENMIIFNKGHGIQFHRWDGWIFDNIINNNHGYGIYAPCPSASVTITGNRIEWNRSGGLFLKNGNHYQINSNYFDRSGGPSIYLTGEIQDELGGTAHSITGNVIHRSGALIDSDLETNCHIYLENQAGVTCTGNVMTIGKNDNNSGQASPSYGIIYKSLQYSIIKNNTLFNGAIKKLIVDADKKNENCVIKDNPGKIFKKKENKL